MDDVVTDFLQAADVMNEWTISVSLGGMTTILLIWSATLGIKDDFNLRGFRWPKTLILPFLILFCSFLGVQIGFHSAVAGFRWEVMRGKWWNGQGWSPVLDPEYHFGDQYAEMLQVIAGGALIGMAAGIFLIALWFVLNVLFLRRR